LLSGYSLAHDLGESLCLGLYFAAAAAAVAAAVAAATGGELLQMHPALLWAR
jgi:hypothetical protein